MPANLGEAVLSLRTDNRRLDQGIGRGKRSAQDLDRSFTRTSSNVVASIGRIGAAFGVAFGVGTFARALQNTIEFGASIADAADAVGIGAEALQRWRFAGEQSALSTRDVDDALRRFNRRLGLFTATGASPAKRAFEELGVAGDITAGKFDTTEAALGEVIGRLSDLPDQAKRAALASLAFGEDVGPRMATLLGQSRDALQALIDQAPVLSNAQVKAAREINDEWNRVTANISTWIKSRILDLIQAFRQESVNFGTEEQVREDLARARQQLRLFEQSFAEDAPIVQAQRRQVDLLASVVTGFDALAESNRRMALFAGQTKKAVDDTTDSVDQLGAAIEGLPPLHETITFGRPGGPSLSEFQRQLEAQRRRFGLGDQAPDTELASPETTAGLERQVGFVEALGDAFERMASPIGLADSLAQTFVSNISTGITNTIFQAETLSDAFRGVVRSIAEAVTQALIFAAVSRGLGFAFGGGGGGGFGQGFTTPGGQFVPTLQHGGFLGRGHAALVGERGPELFVPSVPGRVFSDRDTRRALASSETNVEVNVINPPSPPRIEDRGGGRIDITFDEAATQTLLKPGSQFSKGLRDRFGLNVRTQRR